MKRLLIILILITSFSYAFDHNKALEEISVLDQELIIRYKKNLDIDFTNKSKNTKEQIRFFNETLYLMFLSKYVDDIKDVKIYKGKNTENILIFADKKIDRSLFADLYLIFSEISKMDVKLIQVPVNTSESTGIIQEIEERR